MSKRTSLSLALAIGLGFWLAEKAWAGEATGIPPQPPMTNQPPAIAFEQHGLIGSYYSDPAFTNLVAVG